MGKLILFDIEASNLNANFGICLCVAWKVMGEKKVHSVSLLDGPGSTNGRPNDRYVVKTACAALSQADAVCGWYSKKYDWPFLQTRLLAHRMKPMPPIAHKDAWEIARYRMKLNSNRLKTVSEFLMVEEKTALNGPIWIGAAAGNKKDIKYVLDHCKQDVLVLEEVYELIRPLDISHPNLAVVDDRPDTCPICNTPGRLQKRGYSIARVTKTPRFQCQACGGWSKGPPIRAKNVVVR